MLRAHPQLTGVIVEDDAGAAILEVGRRAPGQRVVLHHTPGRVEHVHAGIGADPEHPVGALRDRPDARMRQRRGIAGRVPETDEGALLAAQAIQPIERPHPQPAAAILEDGLNAVVAQALWIALVALKPMHPLRDRIELDEAGAPRADPHHVVRSAMERRDVLASREAVAVGGELEAPELAPVVTDQSAFRAQPDEAARILHDAVDHVVDEAFGDRQASEHAALTEWIVRRRGNNDRRQQQRGDEEGREAGGEPVRAGV